MPTTKPARRTRVARAPAKLRAAGPLTQAAARQPRATARAPRDATAADARTRLLQAGLELARHHGLRALAVRGVAQAAGVNLGSFVYHFGTREAFIAELIEHWYAPFYAALQSLPASGEAPLPRLRRLLQEAVAFLLPNQDFIAHVLMDAAAGEPPARRFVASLVERHPRLIMAAIAQAQAAGAVRRDAPPMHLMLFVLAAIGGPVLALGGALRNTLLPPETAALLAPLLTDPATAHQRIDWALRGIAAVPESP